MRYLDDKFNRKEYLSFLKSAYRASNIIYAHFDEVIEELALLQNGKFSDIADSIIGAELEYDSNRIPHSRLQMKKDYPVYRFLESIDDWNTFSEMDSVTEVSLWEVDFYYDNKRVGTIVSHYRDYNNRFYLW
ncbi:MAG: hypothetical protein LUF00_11310 [Lachnospiraceae bacterium]|nr:hypothetical protein [Lachnospiraceae bacterium]